MENIQRKRGNYLSIDGGPSGLPALYILEELFSRLQSDIGSNDELIPCRWFDMVIGTGRGAIVALLIGKLGLTASKAIEAYMKLAPFVSVKPAKTDTEKKANAEAFEKAFSEVLSDAGFAIDAPMLDENGTKTIVCAANSANISVLYPIRSYRTRGAPAPPCTILQAACACVAFPDGFLPAAIGTGHRIILLVDAITVYANPTKELLKEAQKVFGDEAEAASIISIGAGKWNIQVISGHGDAVDVNEALKRGIVHSEQIHQDLDGRLLEAAVYFRFNIGAKADNELDGMLTHTSAYLGEPRTTSQLDEAIQRIQIQPSGAKLKEINSVAAIEIQLKPRPRLVQNFVGREDVLEVMRQTHFAKPSSQLQIPTISVLSGLGGSGKTQTALKFALELEEKYPDFLVYFLDASAPDKLKTDLETVIRSQGAAYHTKSYEDALIWMATKQKNWLAILDNADDPSFNLLKYIPKCSHGHVIITTRNATHASLAPNNSHALEGLSESDAVTLVLGAAKYPETDDNRNLAQKIVLELGYLPLALAHAAGYILVHRCLGTYVEIYRKNQEKIWKSSDPRFSHEYHSSVATTIQISLDRLSSEAYSLMRLFSHFQTTSIPHSIVVKAAERQFRRVEKTTEYSLNPQTLRLANALMKILCPDGEWSEYEFNELLSQCLQYSLLQLATQGEDKFYSMHVLVQSYLRKETRPIQDNSSRQLVARLLGSAVTCSDGYRLLAFNRLLLPHIRLIQVEEVIEAGDHYGFGHVLSQTGDGRLALLHWEKCVEMWTTSLGAEHSLTISAMGKLAHSYTDIGKNKAALELHEKVLDIRRRLLGPQDDATMAAMINLAGVHKDMGRAQAALDLEEPVLETRRRLFGAEHPDTIVVMGNLATSYSMLGRHQEALKLDQEVVDVRMRLLGPEDPSTMWAMGRLADSYSKFGNYQKALELEEQVLETQRKLLGPEHPETLLATTNLAVSYKDVGRIQEAMESEEKVLEMQKALLGLEHPSLLRTMGNLATSYSMLERDEEALALDKEVVEMRSRLLGPEHPSTMRSMVRLADSYYMLGRHEEARQLEEKTLEMQTRILGQHHPNALKTMWNLLSSYKKLDMQAARLELLKTAVPAYEASESYGVDHPTTVRLRQRLAVASTHLEDGDTVKD